MKTFSTKTLAAFYTEAIEFAKTNKDLRIRPMGDYIMISDNDSIAIITDHGENARYGLIHNAPIHSETAWVIEAIATESGVEMSIEE